MWLYSALLREYSLSSFYSFSIHPITPVLCILCVNLVSLLSFCTLGICARALPRDPDHSGSFFTSHRRSLRPLLHFLGFVSRSDRRSLYPHTSQGPLAGISSVTGTPSYLQGSLAGISPVTPSYLQGSLAGISPVTPSYYQGSLADISSATPSYYQGPLEQGNPVRRTHKAVRSKQRSLIITTQPSTYGHTATDGRSI